MQKNVVIVGAGTAGLILAKQLALGGVDTTVHEAKKAIGDGIEKASGILSIGGLSSLGIDYADSVTNILDTAILHAGREQLVIKTTGAKAFVVDRRELARLCAKEATAAGAKIVLDSRLGREELKSIADGCILVGADGAVSNVASTFAFPKINEYVLTYKTEYENVDIDDYHTAELFFSNNSSHRFFAWTVPYSKERLEVGIGESMHSKRNSKSAFNTFINSSAISGRLDKAKQIYGCASIIPLECRKETVKGNVLLIGDAAGQVKATTGGGVIFGGMCAKSAARAILDHINKGTKLEMYDKAWRKDYGLDLKLHKLIHEYYSSLSSSGFEMVLKISKIAGVGSFLGKYGDMDKPSTILKNFILRGNKIR